MSQYATIMDLIERADGDEIIRRGAPTERLNFRQAVPLAADIATTVPNPHLDDIALAQDDGLLYRYAQDTWTPFTIPKLDRVLVDASAIADDHLRARYQLPLEATPRSLILAVCDIARFALYDDDITDAVKLRFTQAMKYLDRISRGEITLDNAEALPEEDGPGSANISGPGRVFGRDQMKDVL